MQEREHVIMVRKHRALFLLINKDPARLSEEFEKYFIFQTKLRMTGDLKLLKASGHLNFLICFRVAW